MFFNKSLGLSLLEIPVVTSIYAGWGGEVCGKDILENIRGYNIPLQGIKLSKIYLSENIAVLFLGLEV